MSYNLVFFHIICGIVGTMLPMFVFFEATKSPDKISFIKARTFSFVSFIFVLLSWLISGWHYVMIYGPFSRKPILLTKPWVHMIIMESKEHTYLLIPFLSLLLLILTWEKFDNTSTKIIKVLTISLFLLGAYMAVTGYVISQTISNAFII